MSFTFLRLCLQGHYTLHFADNGFAGILLTLEIVTRPHLSDDDAGKGRLRSSGKR